MDTDVHIDIVLDGYAYRVAAYCRLCFGNRSCRSMCRPTVCHDYTPCRRAFATIERNESVVRQCYGCQRLPRWTIRISVVPCGQYLCSRRVYEHTVPTTNLGDMDVCVGGTELPVKDVSRRTLSRRPYCRRTCRHRLRLVYMVVAKPRYPKKQTPRRRPQRPSIRTQNPRRP